MAGRAWLWIWPDGSDAQDRERLLDNLFSEPCGTAEGGCAASTLGQNDSVSHLTKSEDLPTAEGGCPRSQSGLVSRDKGRLVRDSGRNNHRLPGRATARDALGQYTRGGRLDEAGQAQTVAAFQHLGSARS